MDTNNAVIRIRKYASKWVAELEAPYITGYEEDRKTTVSTIPIAEATSFERCRDLVKAFSLALGYAVVHLDTVGPDPEERVYGVSCKASVLEAVSRK